MTHKTLITKTTPLFEQYQTQYW